MLPGPLGFYQVVRKPARKQYRCGYINEGWYHILAAIFFGYPLTTDNPARTADINNIANAIVSRLSYLVDGAKERGQLRASLDTKLFARCLYSIYYQQLQTWLSGYVSRRVFQKNLESMLALLIEDKSR